MRKEVYIGFMALLVVLAIFAFNDASMKPETIEVADVLTIQPSDFSIKITQMITPGLFSHYFKTCFSHMIL